MASLQGQPAEVHMTVQVKRKESGQVEEYQLAGRCTEEEAIALGATKAEPAEKE